jgi:hypothetical protein
MDDTTLAQMQAQLDRMQHQLDMQNDVQAIRTLQFTYGYYMDKCLFPQIVELFADDAEIYFLNGHYKGKEGARRMYGGASGLNGPTYGMMFEHLMAQDVIHVAPDRQTASGRFRCFEVGGVHETKTDAPDRIPRQFFESGLYENEYVRIGDTWKIQVFNYNIVWQANFAEGWARTPVDHPLMVSPYTEVYPLNPRGPDELRDIPPRWPEAVFVPFHYPNPVSGEDVTLSA